MWQLQLKWESCQQAFFASSPIACKSGFHMCWRWAACQCIYNIGKRRGMSSLIVFWLWMSHSCIHLTWNWSTKCCVLWLILLHKIIAQHSQGALYVMYIMLFTCQRIVFDHPESCLILQLTVHTHSIMWLILCGKRPQLLEHGIILLIPFVVCKASCSPGVMRFWHTILIP